MRHLLVFFFFLLLPATIIAGSSPSSAGYNDTVTLAPGESWSGPQGESVTNDPSSTSNITIKVTYDSKAKEKIVKAKVTIPKGAKGAISGFHGNGGEAGGDSNITVDVPGGTVSATNCSGIGITISGGGSVNCTGCDHNTVRFPGTGVLTGPGGGNDYNTVHHQGRGTVDDFRGTHNWIGP